MPIAAFALALMLPGGQELPALTITPSGDGYVVAAAPFPKPLFWQVDAAAMAQAAATCGKKQLLWGAVRFMTDLGEGGKPATVRDYRHDFRCIAVDSALHPPAPANWTASGADIADARGTALAFLQRRDAGDMEGAFSMFDPLALGDREQSIAQTRAFLSQTAPGRIRILGVQWLINPPRLPYPGVFAVVRLTGDYPGLHFYCGYVGLYRRGPGDYQVIRNQFSYLARGGNDALAHVARMKAELCSDY